MRWKLAAAFAIALFAWADPALAGDTFNLKLTKDNDAVDQQAHWRHRWWHHGYYGFYGPYRSFNYYPRPYRYAYWYPRAYFAPYVYYSYPAYYYSYATPYGYYSVSLGATATPYAAANGGSATFRVQPPTDVDLPPPRPYQEDSFQYDGGPSKAPPTPREEAAPLKSPPVNSVPLEGRSVSLPAGKAKYTYAAYGEEPTQSKAGEDRAVTVKKDQGKK
jgi:hypothetical protein